MLAKKYGFQFYFQKFTSRNYPLRVVNKTEIYIKFKFYFMKQFSYSIFYYILNICMIKSLYIMSESPGVYNV